MSEIVPRRPASPAPSSSGLSKLPDLPRRVPGRPKPGPLPGNRPIVTSNRNPREDDEFMGYID
ncbi:hypothetical protein [Lyngbya confervoides]|uniref:Uncharacterized protein n=1 Tax=Lyngbya confervoides BDU141951 TaxID=1574623 RepID=A0ABD4T980_9CYAN|nr:hypothetical protein [Lyngbya confervoides]MCM1985132.1 hypothetical protein [Lyngbya confervoides BDU141951]